MSILILTLCLSHCGKTDFNPWTTVGKVIIQNDKEYILDIDYGNSRYAK